LDADDRCGKEGRGCGVEVDGGSESRLREILLPLTYTTGMQVGGIARCFGVCSAVLAVRCLHRM
jgi:hypothetical protein